MTQKERRILCVDDDVHVLELYKRIFEEDFEVRLAGDVATATESLNPNLDVILVSLYLDGSLGVDLLQKIKEDPELKEVPVLVVSAMPKKEWGVVCKELGAEDYIEKPFKVVELKSVVDKIVGRK